MIMKKSIIRLLNYCGLAVVLLTISGLFYSGCNYGKIKQISTSGQLTLDVDENEEPLIKKEVAEFTRLNPNAKIDMKVKTTAEVMADLINGDIKTVIVDRDFTPQEQDLLKKYNIEVKTHRFAINGIAVIVNPSNPINKLNFNELRKIFNGKISNWKDLDSTNKGVYKEDLKIFIARPNSAIHDIFKEEALANREYSKSALVCSTSTQMLNEIQNNKNGIGFISMSWITKSADTLDTLVKPLKIAAVDSLGRVSDYIGLHQAYIANNLYPLRMFVYTMSRDFDMDLSVGFTSFLLAFGGQKVVLNSGLVPMTQPVRLIQLN
jgi:phosphate transport system substrate-binding protein